MDVEKGSLLWAELKICFLTTALFGLGYAGGIGIDFFFVTVKMFLNLFSFISPKNF
jgi:hypothetical protein